MHTPLVLIDLKVIYQVPVDIKSHTLNAVKCITYITCGRTKTNSKENVVFAYDASEDQA